LRCIFDIFSKRVKFHGSSRSVRDITLSMHIQKYSVLCHQQRSYARDFFVCFNTVFQRQLCVRSVSVLSFHLYMSVSNGQRHARSRPFVTNVYTYFYFPCVLYTHPSCSNWVIVNLLILNKEYKLWNLFVQCSPVVFSSSAFRNCKWRGEAWDVSSSWVSRGGGETLPSSDSCWGSLLLVVVTYHTLLTPVTELSQWSAPVVYSTALFLKLH
jgi:hypothetical protein